MNKNYDIPKATLGSPPSKKSYTKRPLDSRICELQKLVQKRLSCLPLLSKMKTGLISDRVSRWLTIGFVETPSAEALRKLVEEHPEADLLGLLNLIKSHAILKKWGNRTTAWLYKTLKEYQISYIPKSRRNAFRKRATDKVLFNARIDALRKLTKKHPRYSCLHLLYEMKKKAIFGDWSNKSYSWLLQVIRKNKISYDIADPPKSKAEIGALRKLVEEHPKATLVALLNLMKSHSILKKWGDRRTVWLSKILKKHHINYRSKSRKDPFKGLATNKALFNIRIAELRKLIKEHPRYSCLRLLAEMQKRAIFGDWSHKSHYWLLHVIRDNRLDYCVKALPESKEEIGALRKLVEEHPSADLSALLNLLKEHPILKKWEGKRTTWLSQILKKHQIEYVSKSRCNLFKESVSDRALYDVRMAELKILIKEHPRYGCLRLLAEMKKRAIFGNWGYRSHRWLLQVMYDNDVGYSLKACFRSKKDLEALRKLVKEHPEANLLELLDFMKEHAILKKWGDRTTMWLSQVLKRYHISYVSKSRKSSFRKGALNKVLFDSRIDALRQLIKEYPEYGCKRLLVEMQKKPIFGSWSTKSYNWLLRLIRENKLEYGVVSCPKSKEEIGALRKLVEEHPKANLLELLNLMKSHAILRRWGNKTIMWLSQILKKHHINYLSKNRKDPFRGLSNSVFNSRIAELRKLIKEYPTYSCLRLLTEMQKKAIFGDWGSRSHHWLLQVIRDNGLDYHVKTYPRIKEAVEDLRKLVEEHPKANLLELLNFMKEHAILKPWGKRTNGWLYKTLKRYNIEYTSKSRRSLLKGSISNKTRTGEKTNARASKGFII